MFLDLWSLVILTGDLLELIGNRFGSESFTVSLPVLIFLFVIGIVSLLAWRSTYIPDLPPVPRPPYVIQISGSPSPLNNNGERNTLSDVRLLSSGADVDSVLRRFPLSTQNRGNVNQNRSGTSQAETLNSRDSTTVSANNQATRTTTTRHYQQGQRQDGSVLLGLLRPSTVIRPLISNRTTGGGGQVPNLIVYHRVNVYHHHHHHHPSTASSVSSSENSQQSQAVPSTSSAASRSVDSSTQYETTDATSDFRGTDSGAEGIEIEVSPDSVNDQTEGNIIVESGSEEHISSIQSSQISGNVPVSIEVHSEGLRQRSTVTIRDSVAGDSNSTESIQSDTNVSDTSSIDAPTSSSMMGHHQRNEEISKGQREAGLQATSRAEEGVNDIKFTIKFLNDTQMDVTSQAGEKIADFKRRHFATELSENKTVRLIFNGRVLDNETSTLRESGIFEQCVVHCLIVSRPTATSTSSPTESEGGHRIPHQSTRRAAGLLRTPEPGMFFVAFVGVFLIFLWFICFHFGQHLFTQSAVVSLTVLTAIFLIGLVAFYLPVHPNPNQQ